MKISLIVKSLVVSLVFGATALAGTIIGETPSNASVQPNSIILTAQSTCPIGYTEYTAARGYFLVGVPSGGTVAGTVGSAMTNQQDLTHTHSISSTTASNASIIGAGIYVSNVVSTTGTGASSTIAPYLQIRLCTKN
jgi:hypothetical protein